MIEIEVRKNRIRVTGHAGHAPPGQDIVCAAVSVLVQTLIRSVETLAGDKIEYEVSPGRADIKFGDPSEKSKALVDSFFAGICMVADRYPRNVRIV